MPLGILILLPVELDSRQGSHIFRQNCLAARLAASDSADVFRLRRPDLRAFTYFARTGSASRLNGIWPLETVNAAILVNWYGRVDLPQSSPIFWSRFPKEGESLEWRQLARLL